MSKSPEITLVIPTLNEVDNIDEVFQHLSKTDLNLEVIIVDSDSKDGTREQVKTSAKKYNLNARAINTHKLDLSNSAVVGFREATAKYAALMDADLQHPPKMLQEMFEKIKSQNSDVVLASKYVPGSQLKNSFFRLILSKGFIYMSYFFFPRLIKKVKDPSSGFFIFKRSIIENVNLRPLGFRTLLEILVRANPKKVIEVPFIFGERRKGQSKASMKQVKLHLLHLKRLVFER
jgi:dolichol-phosphate mannosyltransferase